jgi:hypothetical protein
MPPSTSKEDIKMDKIWANRLIAGTKTWAEMPASRRPGVKRELAKRVADGEIDAERYKEITGEDYNG